MIYLLGAFLSLLTLTSIFTIVYLKYKNRKNFDKDGLILIAIFGTIIGTALSWVTLIILITVGITYKVYNKLSKAKENK